MSLSVYLRASAFKNPNLSNEEPSAKIMFNEGQETPDEQYLRERKDSLLRLFRAVGLRSRDGHQSSEQSSNEGLKNSAREPGQKKKTSRTEIVGDGEEIEVEDGEELSENDLNLIYKRWPRSDNFIRFSRVDIIPGPKQMIDQWKRWNLQIHSPSHCGDIKNKHSCSSFPFISPVAGLLSTHSDGCIQ